MNIIQTICNKCKKVKGEENHWLKIGALRLADGAVTQLTLGNVPEKEMPNYEIHDLCSPLCYHQHIDDILGIKFAASPPPMPLPAQDHQYPYELERLRNEPYVKGVVIDTERREPVAGEWIDLDGRPKTSPKVAPLPNANVVSDMK